MMAGHLLPILTAADNESGPLQLLFMSVLCKAEPMLQNTNSSIRRRQFQGGVT